MVIATPLIMEWMGKSCGKLQSLDHSMVSDGKSILDNWEVTTDGINRTYFMKLPFEDHNHHVRIMRFQLRTSQKMTFSCRFCSKSTNEKN